MKATNSIVKSLLIGGGYFLMSFVVYQVGCAVIDTFKYMMTVTGIYAVLLFFVGFLLIALVGVTLFFMGAIPFTLCYELRELKKENETKNL